MRTNISTYNHYLAVLNNLQTITNFEVGDGERPKDVTGAFLDPPYAVLFLISGGDMEGPISDSQADITLRFQITAVGQSPKEAIVVQDYCAAKMHKSNLSISGRKVRNLTKVLASNGVRRDDDVPTPVFYCFQQWDLDTTPA